MTKEIETHAIREVNELKTGFGLHIIGTYPIDIFEPAKRENSSPYYHYTWLKRIIDIVGIVAGLLLTLPTSIVLVVVIKVSSKRLIFYTQERVGKQDRPFYAVQRKKMKQF